MILVQAYVPKTEQQSPVNGKTIINCLALVPSSHRWHEAEIKYSRQMPLHRTRHQRSEGNKPYYHAVPNRTKVNTHPPKPRFASAPGATQPRGAVTRSNPAAHINEPTIATNQTNGSRTRKTHGGEWETPLKQTCSGEYTRAQYAFKSLMIH
eukprot:SAG31_NODE_544_length_14245_cov_68.376644_11_plen_152_part_00